MVVEDDPFDPKEQEDEDATELDCGRGEDAAYAPAVETQSSHHPWMVRVYISF